MSELQGHYHSEHDANQEKRARYSKQNDQAVWLGLFQACENLHKWANRSLKHYSGPARKRVQKRGGLCDDEVQVETNGVSD